MIDMLIKILNTNTASMVTFTASVVTIIGAIIKALEFGQKRKLNTIEEALSKNEFDLSTKQIIIEEKEKEYFFHIYKVYLDRDKRIKIIEFANKYKEEVNIKIFFKGSKYLTIKNNRVEINVKIYDIIENVFMAFASIMAVILSILLIILMMMSTCQSKVRLINKPLYFQQTKALSAFL